MRACFAAALMLLVACVLICSPARTFAQASTPPPLAASSAPPAQPAAKVAKAKPVEPVEPAKQTGSQSNSYALAYLYGFGFGASLLLIKLVAKLRREAFGG